MYDGALFMVLVLVAIEKCRDVHFLEYEGDVRNKGSSCRTAMHFTFTSPSGGVKQEHPALAIQCLAQKNRGTDFLFLTNEVRGRRSVACGCPYRLQC